MTFLKKIGMILGKATQLWLGFQPLLSSIPGTVRAEITSDLTILAGIVVQVEAIGAALEIKGPDKLKATAPIVAQMILSSSIMLHRKVKDPALFQKSCGELGGAMAGILNALDDDIDDVKDKA